MIYTCTLNPSLDYYLEFDKPCKLKITNRSNLEYYEAGGKGINVSIVLNNLMVPTRALGFLGGFTSDFYLSLLQRYEYLQPSFTTIEGHTRINIKIKDSQETEYNAKGPVISYQNFQSLMKKIERIDEGDIFILSGSIPESILEYVEEIIKTLKENNVPFVLDTNSTITSQLLKYQPLLIKPNIKELEELVQHVVVDQAEIVKYAKMLVEEGAINVIVSLGEEGSIMVNQDGAYYSNTIHNEVISSTGAGDSMVAGFVFSLNRGANVVDAFKYANCCGLATTFSKGLATREKIEQYFNLIEIEKIEDNQ